MDRCALLLAALFAYGCSAAGNAGLASGSAPQALPFSGFHAPSGNEFVFVTNENPSQAGSIEYFPVGSNGNVPPTGVISGANTGLTLSSQGVAVNAAGEIYVALMDVNAILGFAPGSNGNVAPNVTISGSNTGLAKPIGLTVDGMGNIYVANCSANGTFGCPLPGVGQPSIEEFAAGSNGNVAPIRRIAGKRTQLIAPFSVALGPSGDIYLLDGANPPKIPSLIDVFRADANGNVAPRQVIAGVRTDLNQAYGLAVTSNGIYADTWNGKYLERFSLRANGDAAPQAVVKGSNTQLGCCLDGMAAGPDGSVYVVDRNGDHSGQAVQQFAPLARGNVAPLTSITGSNTGFATPVHVFVGPQPQPTPTP